MLKIYFPIKVMNDKGNIKSVLMLEKKGTKFENDVATAVLNGVEIDVNSVEDEQNKNDDQNNGPTIDI